jgi:hypothetical protein
MYVIIAKIMTVHFFLQDYVKGCCHAITECAEEFGRFMIADACYSEPAGGGCFSVI